MSGQTWGEGAEFLASDVAALWLKATVKSPYPGEWANIKMAVEITVAARGGPLPPPCAKIERGNTQARAAKATLLEWCNRDEREDYLRYNKDATDMLRLYNYRVLKDALALALHNIEPLLERQPHKLLAWFYGGQQVWMLACQQLEELGRQGGSSPSSVAVAFTSLALKAVGFTDADATAVSNYARTRWQTS